MAKGTRPPKMHSVKVSKKDPWINQTLNFSEKELPEGKDWEVGKTYKLEIEVRQHSKSQEEGKPLNSCFTVTKVKALT